MNTLQLVGSTAIVWGSLGVMRFFIDRRTMRRHARNIVYAGLDMGLTHDQMEEVGIAAAVRTMTRWWPMVLYSVMLTPVGLVHLRLRFFEAVPDEKADMLSAQMFSDLIVEHGGYVHLLKKYERMLLSGSED